MTRILDNYINDAYKEYFDYTKKKIVSIISDYRTFMEVSNRTNLIKSYLHHVEESLTYDPEDDYEDDNGIKLKNLRAAYNELVERLDKLKAVIDENVSLVQSYEKLSVFKDISENCLKTSFNEYECEMCFKEFSCSKHKGGRYRRKYLGEFSYYKDNVLYFTNGNECYYYNKPFTSRINMKCGNTESFEFVRKNDGCDYEFLYTSKVACNNFYVNYLLGRIKLLLK
jgi:hypothetical protein